MSSAINEGQVFVLQAPAKVNLVLRVLGRRADGYHELETWMQKIGLYDTIHATIRQRPGIELTCSHPEIPVDERNLLWRAARLYIDNSRRAKGKGISIHLEKHIPVAAGLGGGSSDAGTLLRELNRIFGQEFDDEQLIDMAVSLGADVPFFVIDAPSVLATGVGEKMVPVPSLRDCIYVLVNPGFGVSTAAIFAKFALTRAVKNSTLTGSRKLHPESVGISALENDLEAVTEAMHPVIADIKEELRTAGADGVLMSGSGPTVFGIFSGMAKRPRSVVEQAVDRLRELFGEKVYIAE